MSTLPFTYLLHHVPTDTYYYGVKFAEGCSPKDLWTTYFTSSNIVKNLIETYGKESFRHEIRKIFPDRQSAIKWEHKILKRLLNKSNKNRRKWLNVMSGETFNVTSDVMKNLWSRDSYAEAQKRSQKATWSNQELREAHSSIMKKFRSKPEARAISSKSVSKIWAERDPLERKNITKNGTEKNVENARKRRQDYEGNKKSCLICGSFLPYEKRKNSACSRKCAAILGCNKNS